MFILPMNNMTIHVANNAAAVEKFAGNINPHTINIGTMIGTKEDLKSFICSCFFERRRAT